MSVVGTLQKKIYELTSGLFATWMPDERLSIGDYGYLSKGRFLREGNLKARGISFARFNSAGDDDSFRYSDGVKVEAGASGKAAEGGGNASMSIKFKKKGAFLYHSKGVAHEKFEDRQNLFQVLFKKILSGAIDWDDNYVIIDEIRTCKRSTIIISEMKSGSMSVTGGLSLDPPENLASAGGKLSFSVESGSILNYAGRKNTRPLYHAVRLKFSPEPGGGGTPLSLSKLFEVFKSTFTERYPEPDGIDISNYRNADNFVATIRNDGDEGQRIFLMVKNADLHDLLGDAYLTPYQDDGLFISEEVVRGQQGQWVAKG